MRGQLPPANPERKPAHPWVIERIVHRAQPHLTETGIQTIPLWLVLGGIIVLMLIAFMLFYFWAGQALGVGPSATEVSSTPTLAPVTRVPVVATLSLTGTAPTPTRAAGTPVPQATLGSKIPATTTPVPTTPTPVPSPTRTTYTVKAGDTLISIADRYNVTVSALMRANNIKNEIIRPGEVLVIPLPTPTPR